MEKTLNIGITKTNLQSFTVTFDESGFSGGSVSLGLLTPQGKQVTSHTVYLRKKKESWMSGDNVELPEHMNQMLLALGQFLLTAAEAEMMNCYGLLDAPTSSTDTSA